MGKQEILTLIEDWESLRVEAGEESLEISIGLGDVGTKMIWIMKDGDTVGMASTIEKAQDFIEGWGSCNMWWADKQECTN